jgi:hypothetical protein
MGHAILEAVLRLSIVLLEHYFDAHPKHDVCNTCVCRGECTREEDSSKRSETLTSYDSPYKTSYRELLGSYGMQRVDGVFAHARRALATGDASDACEIARELRHLVPVLRHPELYALRHDISAFARELSGLCHS